MAATSRRDAPSPGRRSSRSVLRSLLALGAAVAVALAAPGAGAQTYPDPPPDFAHPGVYHDTNHAASDVLFSPVGGTLDRPTLVIYVQFDDLPARPGEDAAWVHDRFFGPGFPSVAGWYDANSFGALALYPAAETQGTADDGVVVVNAGAFAAYNDAGNPWIDRNRAVLELADPFVDYSLFDTDSDGTLRDDELLVINIRVARDGYVSKINGPVCSAFPSPDCPDQCNDTVCPSWDIGAVANRGVAAGPPLDGVGFALGVPMASTACNFMTWVHEVTHSTLHLVDLYAFPVGSFDIAGPTLDAPDRFADRNRKIFSACAWSKVHWGWIAPTVVTADGYYTIPNTYTSGAAFILYDPDRGTDDYFIAENRRRAPGTYDRNAGDTGLVIWRVDEKKFNPPSGSSGPEGGPIARRSPAGGAAWDPSDPSTPGRTMTSPWRDGTPNVLAVRAIGPAAEVMRAYFDVRGPGVLVDPYPLDADGPLPVVAGAAEAVPLPVMNTGEVPDTFTFELVGVPFDWTVAAATAALNPRVEATASVALTAAHDAPVGVHTVTATAASTTAPGVASSAPLDLEVLHRADLSVLELAAPDAPAELLVGDSATFTVTARVTNDGPSWPTDATLYLAVAADPGGSVTPASASVPVAGLEAGEERVLTQTLTVTCDGPGDQTHALDAELQADAIEDVDPVPDNNSLSLALEVGCVVPVALNIRPHGFPNAIEPDSGGVVTTAVLTTAAGEYGLPVAFDAATIDPLTVRFGPRAIVWAETGGAAEVHGTGHLRDSYELDERTRDRDDDMLLHFKTPDTGLQAGDDEACVKGQAAPGYTFFGCDAVATPPIGP